MEDFGSSSDDRNLGVPTGTLNANAAVSNTDTNTPITNKRRNNPLSTLSSYTYNISLYIIKPTTLNEYFENFAAGKAWTPNVDGVYVVAQSGGVGKSEQRALTLDGTIGTGPGYDYYIDDLKIEQLLPTKDASKTPTSDMKFEFTVTEPMGFNFLQQLSNASRAVIDSDPLIPKGTEPTQYQHKFMLGIRFYGYDVNGALQSASTLAWNDTASGLNDAYSIYERFFPIEITEFNFKLDGRATRYMITACAGILQTGYGSKHNIIKSGGSISGQTVGQVLQGTTGPSSGSKITGLVQLLNNEQADFVNQKLRTLPDKFAIEFAPNSKIASALLVDSATYDKTLTAFAPVKKTNEGTVAVSSRAVTINTGATEVRIAGGKTITQIIDNIISSSRYVTDTLSEINNNEIEAKTTSSPTPKILKWYSIIPKIKILGRDPAINDWAYEITYFIQDYEIPYIRTQYAKFTSKFYGAVKKYNYWYTGENSEIMSLEFNYNNLYYNTTPISTNKDASAGNREQGPVPTAPTGGSASDPTAGKTNKGSAYNQNVNASLMSSADNNYMTFKILGDPDFLMSTLATPYTSPATNDRLYGPGNVINAMTGQIFVEVLFKGAVDYMNDGLLQLSAPVKFYANDKLRSKYGIEGLIFELTQCHSTFSKGSFTQTIEGILCDESVLLTLTAEDTGNQRETFNNGQLTIISGTMHPLPPAPVEPQQIQAPGEAGRGAAPPAPRVTAPAAATANTRTAPNPVQLRTPAYVAESKSPVNTTAPIRYGLTTPMKNTKVGPVVNDDGNNPNPRLTIIPEVTGRLNPLTLLPVRK